MDMQVERAIWLTSPDRLKALDFKKGQSLVDSTYLTDPALNMTDSGWVKLGEATITYRMTLSHNEVTQEAVSRIDEAIVGIRAEAEVKINEFLRVKQELLCLEAPETADAIRFNYFAADNWRDSCTCIKTGCGMLYQGRFFWGDLWRNSELDSYLFNAVTRQGELADTLEDCGPYLITVDSSAILEQDGLVIRIPKLRAEMSDELLVYVTQGDSL